MNLGEKQLWGLHSVITTIIPAPELTMATLEDRILGEKLHYYCSSSEDEDEEEDEDGGKVVAPVGGEEVMPPPERGSWEGSSTNVSNGEWVMGKEEGGADGKEGSGLW